MSPKLGEDIGSPRENCFNPVCVKHPHAQSTSLTWKAHACALKQRALGYTGASVDHTSAISILACKNISGIFWIVFGWSLKQREAIVTFKYYYTYSFHQSLYLSSLEKISIWYMNIVLCCVLSGDKHCSLMITVLIKQYGRRASLQTSYKDKIYPGCPKY